MTLTASAIMGLGAHLNQLDALHVYPAAATKVMQVAKSPTSSLVDMERAVSTDPVLAARLLKMANSPMYGLRSRVASLDRAIAVLGFAGTRDVALGLAIGGIGSGLTPWGKRMWRHALAAAWANKVLTRHVRHVDVEGAFVTGLLHDVGLQLLLVLHDEAVGGLLMKYQAEGHELLAAEKESFGTDHTELGGACLRRWGVPPQIADVIVAHHAVDPAREPGLKKPRDVAMLQIADLLAQGIFSAGTVEGMVRMVRGSHAMNTLRIVPTAVEVVAETLLKNIDTLDEM